MDSPDALTRRVLTLGLWGERPLFLLDVGASGGIDTRWAVFAGGLRAIGFDPLIAEVERLNAAERRPGVRYEAAFVGCRNFDELFPPALRNDRIASRNNQPFERVSAAAAQHRMQTSFIQEVFNAGAALVLSERVIALDEFVPPAEYGSVDFVKIDTDGHDIEVLLGAERILAAGGALGLMVEAQFHGATHDYANTFSNIDRLLRQQGFTLFDINTNRYSRSALPAPFELELAAQTTSGQVLWGDAVYFRDLGDPEYHAMWRYDITDERVLKLACLFEHFGLPDCAAELLLNRGGFLSPSARGELLDLLVSGEPGSYARHVAAFERDFRAFYPSRRSDAGAATAAPSPAPPAVPAPEPASELQAAVDQLRARTAALKAKNARLSERLRSRESKIERLVSRVRKLESERNGR